MAGRKTQDPTAREQIYQAFEDSRVNVVPAPEPEEKVQPPQESEPKAEEVQEEYVEETKPVETPEEPTTSDTEDTPSTEPKRKYAGKYESVEELEKSYDEAQKEMHISKQKAEKMEQEFGNLRNYIDWNRLRADMSGVPQPSQQPVVPQQPMDKDTFFQKLAEGGPAFMEEYYNQSPAVKQQLNTMLRAYVPHLAQQVTFRVKLETTLEKFREDYPHLTQFEEQVGRIMFDDLQKNPQKTLMKAMRDATQKMQKSLDEIKEQGKKEAQIIHQEKKGDNIPPGDRASLNRATSGLPKSDEEKPETLSDYISERRKMADKGRSQIGYHNRR